MPCMIVTLDVSRLSGWLNADADCRVERRAYEAGLGEVWARKQEVCRRRRRKQRAGKRTQNMLDMPVTLDVSRLSGWLNVDAPCRVERKEYESNGAMPARMVLDCWWRWDGGASNMQGMGPLKIWRMARTGAHKTSFACL